MQLCGIIVQDKICDAELNTDFYKMKSDTNTVLPHSIILNDKVGLLLLQSMTPLVLEDLQTERNTTRFNFLVK